MNARLNVLHQKSNVKHIKLQPTTMVGRSAECDLKIVSNLVSRVHCRITVNDEAVLVEDLGSANGTFVDGEPLTPHQPKIVNPGSKLVIGPAEFVVEYVTSTTNTIVIRRSSESAKPVLQELRNAANSSDSELLISSSNPSSDDLGPDLIQPKARPAYTPPKPAEVIRPARPAPAVEKAPAAAKPVAEVAKPVPPQPMVKPAAKVPLAPVAKPPVARVVNPAVSPTDDTPTPWNLAQNVVDAAPAKKQPEPQPAKAPVKPPVAAAPPPPPPEMIVSSPFEFAEAGEKSVPDQETNSPFSFGDIDDQPTSPKPSSKEKDDKGKSLKSLFSVFGGKQKSTASSSKPTAAAADPPVEAPVVPVAEPPVAASEDPPKIMFGDTEAPSEESSDASETLMDDDFQNFLRQF